jgi:hypothetical protein
MLLTIRTLLTAFNPTAAMNSSARVLRFGLTT